MLAVKREVAGYELKVWGGWTCISILSMYVRYVCKEVSRSINESSHKSSKQSLIAFCLLK